MLVELRQAIDRSELSLVYQPKFDARTAAVVGVEALLRWRHLDRGLLRPHDFLPLVREHGLMGQATSLVVNMALDDAERWYAAGAEVPVAVNLFAPLLSDLNLPDHLSRALDDRGLAPSALAVEITEDLFVDNMEDTRTVLTGLVDRGIRIALDDFGTGYSALTYLSDLPIDEIKLDHDFIARAAVDERAAMVVQTIIDLAHKLGFGTVAEGIESAESAAQLRDFGCDVLQGFFLSPPLPAAEVPGVVGAGARLTF
ncbi:EAL domain-containing protein [Mycolicibacterium sp. CBMA 226]|uniref:EAL domain-containing protein n=1 Tax=Mycolicibacterium sp. CBMA 226 TaxID=2606611 RepID=UPI0012DF2537|nr:EAL domain-containing protein [Mycolicibacterium sp. CBMA 226]